MINIFYVFFDALKIICFIFVVMDIKPNSIPTTLIFFKNNFVLFF